MPGYAYDLIQEGVNDTEHETLVDAIEALIDKASAYAVVAALSDVCYVKASHLREAWQDNESAKVWEQFAHKIDGCLASAPV